MSDEKRIEILREIQQAHELVHIMAFDTICETAGWAADEIVEMGDKIDYLHSLNDRLADEIARLRASIEYELVPVFRCRVHGEVWRDHPPYTPNPDCDFVQLLVPREGSDQ